jgi:hypothetical protein
MTRALFGWIAVFAGCANGPSDTAPSAACVAAHEEYFAKELNVGCCDGLQGISREDGVSETYTGDDYPEGCGPSGAPPDLMVCLPCGDGRCEEEENFCNCAADCDAISGRAAPR